MRILNSGLLRKGIQFDTKIIRLLRVVIKVALGSCLAALMLAGLGALAGESGLNVIVVVNQNSSNSLQLGNDYCERRGVPPQNLFRMTGWTAGATNWQESDFENDLLDPLLAMISTNGLTNQA